MKKIKQFIAIGAFIFVAASCNVNDPILFSERDANVSFDTQDPIHKFTGRVNENEDKLLVPVVLAGTKGSPVTVEVEATPADNNPAVEGQDYTITSKTLTFSEGYGVDYIEIKPVNNDVYTGNKSFVLSLKETKGLKYNTNSSVNITIIDDEHPLKHLLGDYTVTGIDLLDDGNALAPFDIAISPDMDGDVSVLWIEGFPYMAVGGTMKFEIIVNEDATGFYLPYQEFASFGYGPFYLGNADEDDPTVKVLGTIEGTVLKFNQAFMTTITDGTNKDLNFFAVSDVVLTKK